MKSIKKLYNVGFGPSSSHTMGPFNAARSFKEKVPNADKYVVTLYGSLSATGKGHFTDLAIKSAFSDSKFEIIWKPEELPLHPNGMLFKAYEQGILHLEWEVYSIGGGCLIDGSLGISKEDMTKGIYDFNNMKSLLKLCETEGKSIWQYVEECEGEDIWDFLANLLTIMGKTIASGIEKEGVLPGGLNLKRKASQYYTRALHSEFNLEKTGRIFAYALAVAEENASGSLIVTSPTCGSAGVLPAVLFYFKEVHNISEEKLKRALATAGLIGNIIKTNASISGAEVGCQGEIGTACAMAAGAAAQLMGGTPHQIEYAAEMGLEHHLGLTCDPVKGLVQIPCIERNAIAAVRAIDCASYALLSDGRHLVSFDEVVLTMAQTGRDLKKVYRETSEGGLALLKRV